MFRKGIFFWSLLFFNAIIASAIVDSSQIYPDTFDIKKPNHFINLSATYVNTGKLNEAKKVIDDGLKTGLKTHDSYLISNLNYFLADYYYYKEEYQKAHELYLEVMPLFKDQKDTLMIAKALNSVGLIYELNQDYEKTLKYYLEEIEMLQCIENKNERLKIEELVVHCNIINLYTNTLEFEKIIKNADKTIQLALAINDSLRLGNIYNTLGTAYRHMSDFNKSLKTYQLANSIFIRSNDHFRNSFVLNNIGVLYEEVKENLDSALFYYTKALNGFKESDYNYGIVNAQTGMASVLSKLKNGKEARKIYIQAIDTAKVYGFQSSLLTAYLGLSQLEYDLGNYKKAFDTRNLYNSLNDSLFTVEKHKQYTELQTKYETSKKELEIDNLKNERLKQDLIIKKSRLNRQLIIIVAIILLITVNIIAIFFNQKRKALRLLITKNELIEDQNKQLTSMNNTIKQVNNKLINSQKELQKVNNAQNRFFSILAHDLRNPFHTILGQSYLLSKTYDNLSVNERITYADDIHYSCEQTNRLLENLLEWGKTQINGVKFHPQRINYKESIQNAISVLIKNAEAKSISISNNIEGNLFVFADREMIETIIRNLVNNSIKFSHKGSKININCSNEGNQIVTCIQDSGVGIPESKIFKLFDIDADIKTLGTNKEKGTGLGLVICKEFIKLHNGDIWVESKPEIGSRFYFTIPLNSQLFSSLALQ